mmetsp:Transcript_20419/g.32867  ORF Transcript_20419/g.32867 Transcript_20419/m.32867 type:complete len:325 (-) Transcript_20419:41-1015(-)
MFQGAGDEHAFPMVVSRVFLNDEIEFVTRHYGLNAINILKRRFAFTLWVVPVEGCIAPFRELPSSVQDNIVSDVRFPLIHIIAAVKHRRKIACCSIKSFCNAFHVGMPKVPTSTALDKSGVPSSCVRGDVLGFATAFVRTGSCPPEIAFHVTSLLGSRRWILVIPGSVMLKVAYFPVPAPGLRNPLSSNHVSIFGSLMPLVTPNTICRSFLTSHINRKSVELAIFETVAGQEIIFRGIATIFKLSFDTNIDAHGHDILGEGIFLPINPSTILRSADFSHVVRNICFAFDRIVINVKGPVVSRDSKHDVFWVHGVDFNNFLKTTV